MVFAKSDKNNLHHNGCVSFFECVDGFCLKKQKRKIHNDSAGACYCGLLLDYDTSIIRKKIFGGKIVFNRYFAIQPYATVGFNVVQRKFSFLHGNYTTYNLPNGGVVKLLNDTSSTTKTKINIGLSTGAGIELLIYERLSIGADYRHTVNQFKIFENSKTYSSALTAGLDVYQGSNPEFAKVPKYSLTASSGTPSS